RADWHPADLVDTRRVTLPRAVGPPALQVAGRWKAGVHRVHRRQQAAQLFDDEFLLLGVHLLPDVRVQRGAVDDGKQGHPDAPLVAGETARHVGLAYRLRQAGVGAVPQRRDHPGFPGGLQAVGLGVGRADDDAVRDHVRELPLIAAHSLEQDDGVVHALLRQEDVLPGQVLPDQLDEDRQGLRAQVLAGVVVRYFRPVDVAGADVLRAQLADGLEVPGRKAVLLLCHSRCLTFPIPPGRTIASGIDHRGWPRARRRYPATAGR